MASWTLKAFLLVALLASVALAAPIRARSRRALWRRGEVDKTAVQVAEVEQADQTEEFYVTVVHVEDDVDDTTEEVDAERTTVVALKFDVLPDLTVTVNGQAVTLGVSTLEVKGEVVATGETEKLKPVTELTVQIFVGVEEAVDSESRKYHHVVIQERIIEVEDDRVWQAAVRQQMVDVHQDGKLIVKGAVVQIEESVSKLPPLSKHDDDDDNDDESGKHHGKGKGKGKGKGHHGHGHGHGHGDASLQTTSSSQDSLLLGSEPEDHPETLSEKIKCTLHELKHTVLNWYHGLPFVVRIIVAFLVGLIAGFFVITLATCVCRCCGCKSKKCTRCIKGNYDANLREYAVVYTAVPLDEKEKKEGESGSAELV